jgi:methyltransferase-like protein
MVFLAEEFPRGVPLHELAPVASERAGAPLTEEGVTELVRHLMSAFTYNSRLVSVHLSPGACARTPGPYPVATKAVRYAAAHQERLVTNALHMHVEIDDAGRHILPLLDGTRDRFDLLAEVRRLVDSGELDPGADDGEAVDDVLTQQLEAALRSWGKLGLLLA